MLMRVGSKGGREGWPDGAGLGAEQRGLLVSIRLRDDGSDGK